MGPHVSLLIPLISLRSMSGPAVPPGSNLDVCYRKNAANTLLMTPLTALFGSVTSKEMCLTSGTNLRNHSNYLCPRPSKSTCNPGQLLNGKPGSKDTETTAIPG